jgi:hypothetical protein
MVTPMCHATAPGAEADAERAARSTCCDLTLQPRVSGRCDRRGRAAQSRTQVALLPRPPVQGPAARTASGSAHAGPCVWVLRRGLSSGSDALSSWGLQS